MSNPWQPEPTGWRQPGGRGKRFGIRRVAIWVVVIGGLLLVAVTVIALVYTLATYG